jgi:hypothetical protein
MSMVDNYATTLNALKRFIGANCPAGAERDLDRLEERPGNYLSLEFRREHVGCTLYIELDAFSAESVTDVEGNRWRTYTLTAKPSWPSYGSVELEHALKFVKLVQEVNELAAAILKEFSEPIVQLVETAEQAAARKQAQAEESTRAVVKALIRRECKGMRVGQERRVEVPGADLLPVGEVSYWDGDRKYTTNVTATRAFYFMRTA